MNTLELQRHAIRLCEFHCEVREAAVKDDRRLVRGYASTSDVDRYQEIVDPKAFKRTIGYYRKNGIVLLDHDPRKRVGKPSDHEIDDKGLWFEAEIAKGIHPLDVREQTWSEIEQGVLKAFSIGFRVLKIETVQDDTDDKKAGARSRILDLELYEISLVGIPANRQTMFSIGKGLTVGSDAPIDLYRRGYWPSEAEVINDTDALARYWSGRWSGDAGSVPETEGGDRAVGESDDDAELRLRTKLLTLEAR